MTEEDEPRRFEFPWLAVALIVSMGLVAYALYRMGPINMDCPLPEAPGSPYGASMMGPGTAPAQNKPPSPQPAEPAAVPLAPPTKP